MGNNNQSWHDAYNYWVNNDKLEGSLLETLKNLSKEEAEDCFYKYIEFGTGGMRGVIGAGTNRMNVYIVRRATFGYADYLLKHVLDANKRGIVIAYDNRYKSQEFAYESARILAMKGLKVYLFETLRPTPELSFTVRQLKAAGGIVITASHNPPQYNGYKLYNETGCQLVPSETDLVGQYILKSPREFEIEVDNNTEITSKINYLANEADDRYLSCLSGLSMNSTLDKHDFKIVFSPQHGTSLMGVKSLLSQEGYDLILVKEQCSFDPDFSNTKSPNPEDEAAYELAIEYARENDADLILTTDPDADRVGAAVKTELGEYRLITGNQMGAILLRYIISQRLNKGNMPRNPYAVTTTVTSELGAAICQKYGIQLDLVHTGFKYIGDRIHWYEKNDPKKTFIFGYEESYGYLISDQVRDKDALQACLITAELACYYKQKFGKTLIDVLEDIYKEYGYYVDKLYNFTMPGKNGQKKIAEIMGNLRNNPPKELAGIAVLMVEDFMKGLNGLEPADVVKIKLTDGSFIAVRPSGTEPKFKMYCCIKGDNQQLANEKLEKIYDEMKERYVEIRD